MPFDGADDLQHSLAEHLAPPTKTEVPWHRRWRALFELKRPVRSAGLEAKLFEITPDGELPSTVRLLAEARQLIEARPHWTQGAYETWSGRYCAVGALRAAGRRLQDVSAQSTAHDLLLTVARQRGFRHIEALNDTSSHEHVLSAFDEAIALARRRAVVAE